jgi:hypothetical protein
MLANSMNTGGPYYKVIWWIRISVCKSARILKDELNHQMDGFKI